MDAFARRLLDWFDEHGRHDLPWQEPRTAYRVWVSEIMLQQTRVSTVIPYFHRFMQAFPGIAELAAASDDAVMAHWAGLGYYSRARNLHRAAGILAEEHGGRFPRDFEAVVALPGIGPSTAGAILAQAFGQRHAILDGNVKRVLARQHAVEGWPGRTAVNRELWALAEGHTPGERVADYTQAIMDLGATICRSRPECERCPVAATCRARVEGRTADLPTPRPRKRLPERESWMLVAAGPEGVLLEKRPPSGIWGGMWCFPEFPGRAELEDWLANNGLATGAAHERRALRHTFTHFRLTARPLVVETGGLPPAIADDDRLAWYRGQSDMGLAAPVRKLIDSLTRDAGQREMNLEPREERNP